MGKPAFAELLRHQQLLRTAALRSETSQNAPAGPAESQLGKVVAKIGAYMRERFAREEAPAGYFAFVCTTAPRYLTMVETLRAEHDAIAARLSVLEARTNSADGEWDDLLGELKAIIAMIEDHEALEQEILRDALEPHGNDEG